MLIETAADFERDVWPGNPKPGHEGLRLDFKRQLDAKPQPEGHREGAIDVVSFANAEGGTLMYGVDEGTGPNGYKVATGLHPIDVDRTKEQLEAAITKWLPGGARRPEMFPLSVGGQSVLVVHVRPSARLLPVRAAFVKTDGLSYVGRSNHGKYFMEWDEVEHRIQSSASRSMRIRIQEFLDSTHSHGRGEPLTTRLYYGRGVRPSSQPINLIPIEWPDCTLVAAGEWGVSLQMRRHDRPTQTFPVEVPYELISLAWWQPTSGVQPPGRPALLIEAHVQPAGANGDVIEVTPLLPP